MQTVSQLLRERLPTFPRAERTAAAVLLANYPAAGLNTVATVAREAGVSAPTVLRLVARIGFESYPDFQKALLRELDQRSLSPLQQIDAHSPDADALTRSPTIFLRSVDETLRGVSQKDYLAAVSALSSPRLRVYAAGGRFSSVLAKYFILQLEMLRPGTQFFSIDDGFTMLTDLTKNDLLLVIDLRRYQQSTITFGRAAVKQGARLILITDQWLSPLAEVADHVLSVNLDAPHPLDSVVPATAMLEALIAGVVEALGDATIERIHRYDAAWDSLAFDPSLEPEAPRDGVVIRSEGAEPPQRAASS